jgi:glycosyltransferase involved in cell wall biosynthesis
VTYMFSVVIPVYNHHSFLEKAVASALASRLVTEVLLCDDGSTDGSTELCADLATQFPERIRNLSESPTVNRGTHNRLNQLCAHAKAPWIRILNSDDFFLAGSFETLRLIARTQHAEFISGSLLICDNWSKIIGSKRGCFDPEYALPEPLEAKSVYKKDDVLTFLLNQNFIATTTNMAFSRRLFRKIGGFRDFRYAHDLDFALRAAVHGNTVHTSAYLAVYRVHSSNTISELSPHQDGEITRLYARFLHEFPEVEQSQRNCVFLHGNRHINPFPTNSAEEAGKGQCKTASPFHLPPKLRGSARSNALLALGSMSYDFVVLSDSLSEPPQLGSPDFLKSLATYGDANRLAEKTDVAHALGRVIRYPVKDSGLGPLVHLASFLEVPNLLNDGADVFIGRPASVRRERRVDLLDLLSADLRFAQGDTRPVVFVLPIFLAVGGVERNTVEVIRLLRNDFRFVVITTERLSPTQGSLHWQLDEIAVDVFDLAEIAGQEHHIYLLSILAERLSPNLVWICNGSPWLVNNATLLRRLFAHIPIIDQEVYDTELGWVAHYDKKGIQSFDRFIAINSKIRDVFLMRILIPAHRVKLIYPLMSSNKVKAARRFTGDRMLLRNELGNLEGFEKLFIYVGRLTDQKKPLAFLNLVRLAKEKHKSCFFLMLGDGELSEDCDQFIQTEDLTNVLRVSYHPNPPELMAISDGLIITSIYEGLPIAMLEALSVGLPVLATDVGDIKLVLDKFGSGMIFDSIGISDNIENSFSKFSEFLANLDGYTSRARRAQDAVCDQFGEGIASSYSSLFRDCLADDFYVH